MKVSLKREETRGVPGYDLSIEVLRDYYGGISGIRAKAVESKGGEIPSTRMYDSFSSEPDSFSLGEVVGGLRQAHHHFNPSAPELDA